MATVLFVCLHNAGRSQMSQALFERAAAGRHRALSAGSEADPAGHVHPPVVEAMRELGIDLAGRRPRRLTRELAAAADVVVTMGCGDACPVVPGARYVDWELADPKGRPLDEVRATRDEAARRVAALVDELDALSAPEPAGPPRPGLPQRLLLALGEQPPALVGRVPHVDLDVDDAAHAGQRGDRVARRGVVGEHTPVITSTTRKRARRGPSRGLARARARAGAARRAARPRSAARASPASSNGTMVAPVPFVLVSRPSVLPHHPF